MTNATSSKKYDLIQMVMKMKEKEERKCPRCGVNERQYKHGKTKKGKPRYRCPECKCVYSFYEPKYSDEFKKSAIKLYLEGNSGRAVGRILGIGKNTIWGWLKEHNEKLPSLKENDVKLIEQDELYTYIKKRESSVSDDDGGTR